MKLEERVAEATNDKKLKNDLIGEYQNFILAAASKVLKRSVTTSDDEYIIAMQNIIQCRFLRWKKKIQTVKRLNLKYIPLIKAI